jgi:uncharacterized protein YdbL (DUF1318 family)
MKTFLAAGVLLGITCSVYAQSAGDVKRLEMQKDDLLKKITKTEDFLNEDRSSTFTCFADLQAPFEELQKAALVKTEASKAEIEKNITRIIEGNGKNGLKALVAEIEARRAEIRKEKNKLRKAELKKLLEAKETQAEEVAKLAKNELEKSHKEGIQSLITADGLIQLAMNEDSSDLKVTTIFKEDENIVIANGMSPGEIYNQSLIKLLSSCQTKDCVFLMSAEIKNYFAKTLKANQSIRIINDIEVEKNRAYSKKKIFAKLDELVADISKRKPLADLDPSCVPTQKPQDKPSPKPEPTDN